MAPKRYDIFWVDLEPTRGSELRKVRPAVVVSLDAFNRLLETVVVCPLTSQLHPFWRTRLSVKSSGKSAEVAVDQIRTVSKARLGAKIGQLEPIEAAGLRLLMKQLYAEE